jgi:hypothetical protein
MDIDEVRAEVMRAASPPVAGPHEPAVIHRSRDPSARPAQQLPRPNDRLLATERQTAKLLIQNPELFGPAWTG